jgi:hypothetical protein
MTIILMFIAGMFVGSTAGILAISIVRLGADADRQSSDYDLLDHRVNQAIRRSRQPAE